MIETLLFLFLVLLLFLIVRCTGKTTADDLHLPPSPPSLPLLGHLHLLSSSLHTSLHTLSAAHGPLLLLRLGPSRRLLVVSSAEVATHIFKTHDLAFSSRPLFAYAEKLPFGLAGFVTAPYGPYWRFVKKVCMRELLSPRQLEGSKKVRKEEMEGWVKGMLEHVREKGGAIDLGSQLMKLTNNITCRMAMSTCCLEKYEDAEKIRQLVKESFELAAKLCFGDVLGPLKQLSFWVYGKKALDVSKRYDELLEKVLKEHEQKRSSRHAENERDLMDILLDVHHDPHAEFKITRTHIKAFFLDLFIAGTNTSAEGTQWAMAELLNHPEAFEKVRKEIELVTENERLVEESDVGKMPYLRAVVKETLRLHPPAPVMTRECRQHCKINGFDVAPKTAVAINLYAIMRDPDSWDNPNEFVPERFFLQEEDERMKFNFVPFGGGRRGCPGTELAFIFINTEVAAMVQCFDWKIGEDGKGKKVNMQSGSSGLSLSMAQPLLCVPVLHFNPYV
ncbi:cytochrome P450 705A12-like [Vigna umbellata]|uniref:cytochrome P450 705A12-like n=1 Tax=Vigna umbellata TaxID=87088 RepID=UPI001F5F8A14|nr:cytochrome P450 705A12-like [Vigna umbellata]